jgi:tetratricopeptide (TPR) repeat protein
VRTLAAIGLWVILSGCTLIRSTIRSYDVRENGQQTNDYLLRRSLADGRADSALARLGKKGEYRPDDKLLQQLYVGVAAYYAGEYRRSAQALERAHDMAEDRYTKSISKGSLSLMTNDLALPYMPGDNERLLIHYYGMLAYLKLGEMEDAVVEARRLSYQLERFDEKRSPMDASTRATLRYIAGSVFDAAGDQNDAGVAYRNAVLLAGDSTFRTVRLGGRADRVPGISTVAFTSNGWGFESAAQAYGEVVLIVEYGFVAHRVDQHLLVAVNEEDVALFASRDDEKIHRHARRVSDNLMMRMSCSNIGSLEYEHRDRDHDGRADFTPADVWLKLAWPVYHRPPVLDGRPWVTLGDGSAAPMSLQADVSDAIVSDYNRQAALLLTRAVARAAVKQAMAEAAEKVAEGKKGKKKEQGWFAREAFELTGRLFERADTRSWQLLPSQVGVIRLEVPAGRQSLKLTLPGYIGRAGRTVDLGEVMIHPGSVNFLTTRVWGDIRR